MACHTNSLSWDILTILGKWPATLTLYLETSWHCWTSGLPTNSLSWDILTILGKWSAILTHCLEISQHYCTCGLPCSVTISRHPGIIGQVARHTQSLSRDIPGLLGKRSSILTHLETFWHYRANGFPYIIRTADRWEQVESVAWLALTRQETLPARGWQLTSLSPTQWITLIVLFIHPTFPPPSILHPPPLLADRSLLRPAPI